MDAQTEALLERLDDYLAYLAKLGNVGATEWCVLLLKSRSKIRSLYTQLDARATVDAQRGSYISDLQAELKAECKAREKLQVDLFDANHACQGALDCKEKAERKLAEVERETIEKMKVGLCETCRGKF